MKHLFIINPNCGKGISCERCANGIHEAMKEMGITDYEIHVTENAGDGYSYAKKAVDTGEHIRVYACGGDGTLWEVVNACACKENAEVAAYPLGSGNDFIRIFGDKKDLRDVKDHINGKVMKFDLIKCGDEYAINQCSMGLDAEVCANQVKLKKLPFIKGEMAYTLGVLLEFFGPLKKRFSIKIDDEETFTDDVLFCFAGNSRWYGGGYYAAPKALLYDGELDFIIVKRDCSKLKTVGLIGPYKRGEHLSWDRTIYKRGKKITIWCDEDAAINIDGEVRIGKHATFEIVEKGINFVVPACSDFQALSE